MPRMTPGEPDVAPADRVTAFPPDVKHQDRFLEAKAEAREAYLPDIAHDAVCMLLSTHKVNFSWWSGDHDAGEARVLQRHTIARRARDRCVPVDEDGLGRHPRSVCATELRHGTDLHRQRHQGYPVVHGGQRYVAI